MTSILAVTLIRRRRPPIFSAKPGSENLSPRRNSSLAAATGDDRGLRCGFARRFGDMQAVAAALDEDVVPRKNFGPDELLR